MNNFGFYVLGNYSPNIRTFGKYKSTCYRLTGFSKEIFLDFGAGVFLKFIRIVKKEKIDLNNVLLIISHNHIDHNLSLIILSLYLLIYNVINRKNAKKVKVILPKRSIIYYYISKLNTVFDVEVLTQDVRFSIDKCSFSFCHTIHKGESYATKIVYNGRTFVYTSDLARYSNILKDFVKNADNVLIDAGYPHKKLKIYQNYHGRTKHILAETATLNVKKIYATHIRFFSKDEDYYECFPTNVETKLVKIDNYYRMFK